jgi:hypothetical protein
MNGIENDAPNSSIVACVRCCGNVFTGPLPSNERETHIQTHKVMGGIYEVRRSVGLTSHDIYIYQVS